jgi:hypothetical protein
MGRTDSDATLRSNDESFYVLGVQPEIASVGVNQVAASGDRFVPDGIWPANFFGPPKDGYVVGRAHAGKTLAITFASLRRPGDLLASNFVPCPPTRALSFTVPQGKVVYLGDVTWSQKPDGLFPSYSNNFQAAKTYMSSHYPKLADRLEPGNTEFVMAVPAVGCPK